MQLKVLSYPDIEQVRLWRNETLAMNRTPFLLTREQQERFYHDVICNKLNNSRYWGVWEAQDKTLPYDWNPDENPEHELRNAFIAMVGIENIQWENRIGEIGLLMNPEYVHMAKEAIDLILCQAFNYLNLENVYGECYICSPYIEIWQEIAVKYNAVCCRLPGRKYWEGKYWNSFYFTIDKGEYLRLK